MRRTARRAIALALGVALAVGAVIVFATIRFGPRAVAQVFAVEPHPERDYASSEVAKEIASLGDTHAWAGEYAEGDGFTGEVVCVAPRTGFFRWQHWDFGPPFESSQRCGRIEETDRVLHFVPSSASDPDTGYRPSNDFMPVAFGARHYLVPPNEIDAFCRAIAAHNEPRASTWGHWLLRAGDEKLPIEPDATMRPAGLCR
jgi:hypothetical protein